MPRFSPRSKGCWRTILSACGVLFEREIGFNSVGTGSYKEGRKNDKPEPDIFERREMQKEASVIDPLQMV